MPFIQNMAKKTESDHGLITLRLPQKLIDALDALTEGRLSRSQLMRVVIEEFLERDEAAQRELVVKGLFGRSKG